MSVSIIVGGQYGSEGKGKVAGHLAGEFDLSVKSGGPNAGHTVIKDGRAYKLTTIPCSFINKNCLLSLCAASIIDLETLFKEIELCEIEHSRLLIDEHAVIVTKEHKESESDIIKMIASTGKGVGAALINKIKRDSKVILAKDVKELGPYIGKVSTVVNEFVEAGKNVLLEGSQGFGLSIHHGFYPFVTSRETTAGTFCGDVGIGPRVITEIILVIRTFPIRVGGNSGPLENEVDWNWITTNSKSMYPIVEYTTVTKRVRRVAKFDIEMVKKAVLSNSATKLAVNFVDYLDYANKGIRRFNELEKKAKDFIKYIEKSTNRPVVLIGTGPDESEIIDLR